MMPEKFGIHGDFECPHCSGNKFIFIGVQEQKGLFKNRELWNCKSCHSTFARETIDVKNYRENTGFNKRAFPFYYKFSLAKA